MKRFRWPLQRLLEVTVHREQALRAELLNLSQEIVGLRQIILARQAVLRSLLAELAKEDLQKRFSKQQLFMNYVQNDQKQIRRLEQQLKELRTLRKQKNAQFLQIRSSRRTLERLRKEAKQRHLRAQLKLEQKQLDEVAHISFAGKLLDSRACQ